MSTIHQIEANRLNAKKCTGPRTVEGKARSSMNALKSGIHAQSRIIHDEKAEDLDALTAEYHTRWLPTTPEQRMLVDTLVFNEWLQRRMGVVEAQLWEDARNHVFRLEPSVWQGQAYNRCDKEFERLQRRLNAIQRNYRAALQDLQRLRTEQAAEEAAAESENALNPAEPLPDPPATPAADPQQNQPPVIQIGFVPQPPETEAPVGRDGIPRRPGGCPGKSPLVLHTPLRPPL